MVMVCMKLVRLMLFEQVVERKLAPCVELKKSAGDGYWSRTHSCSLLLTVVSCADEVSSVEGDRKRKVMKNRPFLSEDSTRRKLYFTSF